MDKVEIILNPEGVRELLKSDEVSEFLQKKADEIVKKCQEGNYDTNKFIGRNRANVSIATHDEKTFYHNLDNNEILKALK